MKKLIVLLALGFIGNVGATEVTVEGGFVGEATTVGVSVHKGKYTGDAHVGVGNKNKKVVAVGIYRDIIKLDDLTLGAGLSANKVEETKGRILKTTTYQGYDLQLNYKLNKFNLRGTINSNGDVKFGVGFGF